LNPILFSKIKKGGSLCRPSPHTSNYQTWEVENPYSQYDILESLVANWLWVVAWPSDPEVPGILLTSLVGGTEFEQKIFLDGF